MRIVTVSIAALLWCGCAATSTQVETVRYATAAEWSACIMHAQSALAAEGMCGASNCYDEDGRDLIAICVAKVGYPRHSQEETAELLREIRQGGVVSNVAASKIRTYPPGHPVRRAYAKATR
jgi:hypothetical protein